MIKTGGSTYRKGSVIERRSAIKFTKSMERECLFRVDQGHRSKILRYSLVTSEFGQLTAVQRLRDPQRLSGLATRKTGQIPAIPRYTKPLIRGVPERG